MEEAVAAKAQSLRVPPANLRRVCDPASLGFADTREVTPMEGTIGQDRAVQAMQFGLDIRAVGYNLFVAGPPGTGRNTSLRAYLNEIAKQRPVPPDWCYVYNFADPVRPLTIQLPPGRGRELARHMDELVDACRREIPRAFDSDAYNQRRESIQREIQQERERMFALVEEEAKRRGFTLSTTPMGIATVPMRDGHPMSREEYEALPEDERRQYQEAGAQLESLISQTVLQVRRNEKEAARRMEELDKQVAEYAIGPLFDDLRSHYEGMDRVLEYLQHVREDIINNLDAFRAQEAQPQGPAALFPRPPRDDVFTRYKVNCIVNNKDCEGAPVVIENSPTYYNLFGRVEFRAQLGAMVTDHTMIKPGAIHRANGGFLIVQAYDLVTSFLSWEAMKRTLRSKEARIENLGEQFLAIPSTSLSPEPIPLDVKVILVGTSYVYHVLSTVDEEFRKLFKVRADFAVDMERTPETERRYAAFVCNRCRDFGLRPFDAGAVARVIEHGSRLVEDQNKLSTRFIDIADLLVEANFWADKDNGSATVTAAHVEQAIEAKVYRSSLVEERIQELIEDGTIMIDSAGEVVGQVNGISVYDLGDYRFGRPSRITARVSMGRGQVMNIEREIQMSGRIHSKGFLIVQGYLNGRYAQERPLALSASIGFEQVYDEVEGDSASAAELFALLSALAGQPLKQGLAVTGSVNQRGEIQPVGGVNEKIEGFYAVCKARGLTGDQGVIIPRANVRHLMLRREVIDAVAEGKFHVYAISSIDEGLELLTGLPAGEADSEGTYPEGTLNRVIFDRLDTLARKAMEFSRPASRDGSGPTQPAEESAAPTEDQAPEADGG